MTKTYNVSTKKHKLSICVFFASSVLFARETLNKPNIVFIFADDLGWSDLPAYGNKFNEAPNINKLAQDGMLFTDAYASSPVSSPTRASLMSGQYPPRVGVIDFLPGHWRPFEEVIVPKNKYQHLNTNIFTLGDLFQSAGYKTAMFGKWHLGIPEKYHALNRGFDVANEGEGYFNTRFNPPREDYADKIHMERISDFGIDFIRENKDEPFFLMLSHWAVHCLLDAEDALIEKYVKKPKDPGYTCNAVYAAVIEHMDNATGRVLKVLEELGLTENTIIVLYSDNGGSITEHKYPGIEEGLMPMIVPDKMDMYENNPLRYMMTTNAPLRGEKGNLYEGGIRTPLIVKWPKRIPAGTVNRSLVTTVDFYTTFLELTCIVPPANQVLDGISLLPALLKNKEISDRTIYWHYPVYHHGVPGSAVRHGDWKLIENLDDGSLELYNLYHDRSETSNMANAFPERTQELFGLLNDWRKDVDAELPVPNPDFDKARRYEWGTHPDRALLREQLRNRKLK
jgi:arylsulfatase A